MSRSIILATHNQGKYRELSAMFAKAKLPFELLSLAEFDIEPAVEDGLTFIENAIIKARHVAKITGLACIADDSGIEVDALNGRPGIYSARYAGVGAVDGSNVEKLLTDLQGITQEQRGARFQCVIAYMQHWQDPTPIICQGTWQGRILTEPVGDNGFGYDPIFYVPEYDCASAQLEPSVKNTISHRGQAVQQLITALSERF